MSRVGEKIITLENGVTIKVEGSTVAVTGPKGRLEYVLQPGIEVAVDDQEVRVTRASDHRRHRSLHGLTRTLIQNMAMGVFQGYEKKLEMNGVGYKAEVKQGSIHLFVGFPKPKSVAIPEGVEVRVEKNTRITVFGINKEQVGEIAASIRRVRPPEPYKGKGIKYVEERVVRKVGKTSA